MNVRYSLATRFALFFTGALIFCILLTGYLVFTKASDVIVSYSKERIDHTSELAEQSFLSLLKEVSDDVAIISSSPVLNNYINSPTQQNFGDIKELFRLTLENKLPYFQIRFIGKENGGQELIRFDKLNDSIFIPDNLQKKGNLDYYQETIQMEKGQVYLSKINLNEEYGTISEPVTPTVRAASPIFDRNNDLVGILVINVDLISFYRDLERISGRESQLLLIDAEGQYLYTPEYQKWFAFQTGKSYNYFTDFKIGKDSVINQANFFGQIKDIQDNVYLCGISELIYFHGSRKIYLISSIEQDILLQSARAVRSDSLKTSLWVCGFAIVISLLFVNIFSKKIRQVTKAIADYEDGGSTDIKLPTNRKDEIGVLAQRINAMIKGLQERLHLTKFVSDEAVSAVKQAGLGGLDLGGERKEVTIMETDIRGFTSISENMEPEEVVSLLNTYLDKQTEVIQSYGGDIDKFIGDAVLAVFTGEEMADNAVQCAIKIQKEINTLNQSLGKNTMIGIGIDTGPLVMGAMGSKDRMDFTVIGDHVNTSSRLCDAALPGEVIISENTEKLLKGENYQLKQLDPIQVKGKEKPIKIYKVI